MTILEILDLNLIFEHNKSVQDIQSHTLHASDVLLFTRPESGHVLVL